MAQPTYKISLTLSLAEHDELEALARQTGISKAGLMKMGIANLAKTNAIKEMARFKQEREG